MVAVAELAPARGKTTSGAKGECSGVEVRGKLPKLALTALAVASAWCGTAPIAAANPSGATAIHGQANLTANGNQLLVTTQNGAGTNHSAINWQSFSIPAGSSTYFQQPDINSTSINRVVTNTPSLIFGTLGSNGKLVLVNQSGITVGPGALVDTAGFTASALRMTDADAIAGRLRFGDAGVAAGDVSVQGRVLARSGDVVLLGSNVLAGADALVQAPNGNTILAAGQQIEITARGLEGITLQVQAPTDSVVNLGSLQGDAVGIFAGTLKHSGNIQATAVSTAGGRVFLKAADSVAVEGSVTAKALNGMGGTVHATADKVLLKSGSLIDVSGANGGGQALVGGGFHGADASLTNANLTIVEAGAQIKADAGAAGDGGTVVVWADGATSYQGNISARGGVAGGNGGNAEVSGKKYLDFRGAVDLTAGSGQKGTLLLDPDNLTIDANGPGDVPLLGQGGLSLADLPGLSSTITAAQVGALLETGNLKLEAAIDINVFASIGKTTSTARSGLELHAGRDVNLGFGAISSGAGALDIKITADTGSVTGGASLSSAGGKVEIFATSGAITLNSINTQDSNFTNAGSAGSAGDIILAAGNSVSVNSISANGANANSSFITAGNGGNVTITTAAVGNTTILPGNVAAYGGGPGGYGGVVGVGGLITLAAVNGNLLFGGSLASSGSARSADTVRLEALNGGISAQQFAIGYGAPVDSSIDSGGGAITISARDAVNLSAVGLFQSSGKYQANAGNLKISTASARGTIQLNNADASGDSVNFGGAGVGGDISLAAQRANIVLTGSLDASGGDSASAGSSGGAGGNVDIVAGGSFSATGVNSLLNASGGQASTNGVPASVGSGGRVAITQGSGDLVIGNVSGSSVTLNALTGSISQAVALQISGQLTANASNGVVLTNAANSAGKFSAAVSGSGNVAFTNTGALDVIGISVANGDVALDNTGAFSNSGAINAPQGKVTITAHSPLSIGAGVLAGGNIQLTALTNSPTSNMVLNGNLVSTAGGITAQAFNNYVQNGRLSAAQGINVNAGGNISFGPGAFSVGNPLSYTANGVAYTPPWVTAAISGGVNAFVADFLNQFQTALNAQIYVADDPLGKRQLASEGIVVEGNTCPR